MIPTWLVDKKFLLLENFIMERSKIIAHNFKRLRKERKWSQERLAEIGNVSRGYISHIELGKLRGVNGEERDKSFGAEAEEKWAKIFGVQMFEFLIPPGMDVAIRILRLLEGYAPSTLEKVEKMLPYIGEPIETSKEKGNKT